MKIGVTGATGFIGSQLMKQLVIKGFRPKALIQPGAPPVSLAGLGASFESIEGDITDENAVAELVKGSDIVIHLAGYNRYWAADPQIFERVNVQGTRNIVAACLRYGVGKLIHVSSCVTLGASDQAVMRTENSVFNLEGVRFDYAATKLQGELLVKTAVAQSRLPAVILYPASAIGEEDYGPTPIGRSIADISSGAWPVFVSGGACFIDVHDLVRGIWLAVVNGKVGQSYLLAGENLTNQEFMCRVSAAAGVREPRLRMPTSFLRIAGRVSEITADHFTKKEPALTSGMSALIGKYLWFDGTKAQLELGFKAGPVTPAIERCVQWLRSRHEFGYRSNRIHWPSFGGTIHPRKKASAAALPTSERLEAS